MKKIFIVSISLSFLFIIGCATTEQNFSDSTFESHESGSYNNISVPIKDFTIMGPIFVESTVTIEKNGVKNGSEITSYMLIKEAQKLDADDVINVKIDKIENIKKETIWRKDKKQKMVVTIKIITYKATALAIKYK